nr:unnamed protein product [Callosobruchus chinensis]
MIAKTIILFLMITFVITASTDLEEKWKQYKLQYSKQYQSHYEERFRFEVFKYNLKEIEKHNTEYREGKSPWEMGVNQFSDRTPNEKPC